jgi:hypothetical protein
MFHVRSRVIITAQQRAAMGDGQDVPSVGAGTEPEMKAICEQLIVRMGADPSMAPRGRVPVEFHQVGTSPHACLCASHSRGAQALYVDAGALAFW